MRAGELRVGDLVLAAWGECRIVSLIGSYAALEWIPADGSGPWRQTDLEPLASLTRVLRESARVAA